MNREGLFKRCVVLTVGVFVIALGVALSVKADLGTSPVSCVPYVLSLGFPVTIGILSIWINVLLILLQVVLLRRNYQLVQLLQFPVVFLFGFFIDFAMFLTSWVHPSNYVYQWMLCLLSCAVIAFGVFLEVKANVTYLAGEGLTLAISKTFRKEFGKVKIGLDCTLVGIGVVSSLVLLHRLQGVREGTIAAALLVGTFARFYSRKLTFVDALLGLPMATTETKTVGKAEDKRRMVITIAREYGSGGHEIGEKVANALGIAFYDTKLIELSAAESGFTADYIQEHEQKLSNKLLFDLYQQNYAYVNEELPPLDTLFMVQSKVIRDISEKESCVIVGRCADFILKSHPNCMNVFVHADKKYRIERAIREYGLDPLVAEKELEMVDKKRINYYRHYTHKDRGTADNYHLTLDSSVFGVEECGRLIVEAATKRAEDARIVK